MQLINKGSLQDSCPADRSFDGFNDPISLANHREKRVLPFWRCKPSQNLMMNEWRVYTYKHGIWFYQSMHATSTLQDLNMRAKPGTYSASLLMLLSSKFERQRQQVLSVLSMQINFFGVVEIGENGLLLYPNTKLHSIELISWTADSIYAVTGPGAAAFRFCLTRYRIESLYYIESWVVIIFTQNNAPGSN